MRIREWRFHSRSSLGLWIVAAVVVLGTLLALGSLTRRDRLYKLSSAISAGPSLVQRDNRETAYLVSQTFIRRQLIQSSIAEFPPPGSADEVRIVELPDGSYRVKGWVIVRKPFGLKSRYDWTCQLKQITDTRWIPTGYCAILAPPGGGIPR